MNRSQPRPRGVVRFQVATGAFLVVAGLGLPRLRPLETVWASLEWPLVVTGLVLVLSARRIAGLVPERIVMGCAVALWSVLALVGVAEPAFRWADFDFRGEEAATRRFPPYYREPRCPSGTVFFRRDGPEEWTGQPIRTWLALSGYAASETYRDEPVITVRYGPQGFRQEEPATDWEIAVAGDSFVELGCLAHDDLFTAQLAGLTGRRVRNLGASNTGPLTQLHYLEEYGLAPGLRQVVLVFYEGNDLQDLVWESQALAFHARTGKRGYRTIPRQTSLLGALHDAWRRPPRQRGPVALSTEVQTFESREGPVPLTLAPFAPHPADLEPSVVEAWERFLGQYRAFGHRHGVGVLLAYMPCKARVLHGALRRTGADRTPSEAWTPTPLPEWVDAGCRRHGIAMIDLTPGLKAVVETEGLNPFNPMVDTHLNAMGSRIVARVLAEHLRRHGWNRE